jgi:hypothetical protein
MTGTLALLSTMLQNLMAYPAMTTGLPSSRFPDPGTNIQSG